MASRFHLLCWISGLIVVASLASAEVNVPVPGCPPKWTQYGARCFIYQSDHKDMAAAESTCIDLGGNLASIHSVEELRFLTELIRLGSDSNSHIWIGLHDGVKENTWMWTDGSRFDYHIWNHGEPNNYQDEHCVELYWKYATWNDKQCRFGRPFLCAKDL